MNSNQMRVILGASSLKAYVAAPKAFHVLGIVRFGQEYGLLATNADGLYFRVNGSQSLALDSQAVRRAIDQSYGPGGRFAGSAAPYAADHRTAVPLASAAPAVSIRKHRQVPSSALESRQGRPCGSPPVRGMSQLSAAQLKDAAPAPCVMRYAC
jgi:hypothetical protein